MYLMGSVVIILSILSAIFLAGIPIVMFTFASVLITIFFTIVGVIVATSGLKTFCRGFSAVLSAKYDITDEERENAASLFELLAKSVIIISFIYMFLGLIPSMAYIEDLEMLAHRLAVAFVSPIYGMAISLAIFMPAAYVLRKPSRK